MQSPRLTVSAVSQGFDALRGTRVKRVAYGRDPAMETAAALVSDDAVVTPACVLLFRWRFR